MEVFELDIRGSTPARGAGARGLVDLQVGDRMRAQAVPVVVHKPGGADHGAGLMTGPEARNEPTPELVAVLLEYAGKLENAGIARGIIGRLRAGPGILVSANDDKIIAAAPDLADGDL